MLITVLPWSGRRAPTRHARRHGRADCPCRSPHGTGCWAGRSPRCPTSTCRWSPRHRISPALQPAGSGARREVLGLGGLLRGVVTPLTSPSSAPVPGSRGESGACEARQPSIELDEPSLTLALLYIGRSPSSSSIHPPGASRRSRPTPYAASALYCGLPPSPIIDACHHVQAEAEATPRGRLHRRAARPRSPPRRHVPYAACGVPAPSCSSYAPHRRRARQRGGARDPRQRVEEEVGEGRARLDSDIGGL